MSKAAPLRWGSKSGGHIVQALQGKTAPANTNTNSAAAKSTPAATTTATAPQQSQAPAPVPASNTPAPASTPIATPAPAQVPIASASEKVQEKTPPAATHSNGAAASAGADTANAVADTPDSKDTKSAAADADPTGSAAAGGDDSGIGSGNGQRNPLQNEWTMWYEVSKKSKERAAKTYAPERKKIMSFDSVEDFWCLWNNILTPSELTAKRGLGTDKTDYLLFKKDVTPEWEHEKVKGGGQWEVKFNRNDHLDDFWEHAVLSMIGEQFEDGDLILGAAIRLRPKGSRLELWTREAASTEAICRIGETFKELIQYDDKITYASFRQLANGESKAMYDV